MLYLRKESIIIRLYAIDIHFYFFFLN